MSKSDRLQQFNHLVLNFKSYVFEIDTKHPMVTIGNEKFDVLKNTALSYQGLTKILRSELSHFDQNGSTPSAEHLNVRRLYLQNKKGIYKTILYFVLDQGEGGLNNHKNFICQGFDINKPIQKKISAKGEFIEINSLTKREFEVLSQIGEGKSTSIISQDLGIAKSTVENHKANLFKKLNVNKVNELIRIALSLA